LFAPLASAIPLAAMAPVLMLVAWNMSERKEFAHLLKARTGDSFVLVITFLLTVFTNLTTAVEAGLALAILLFIRRMSTQLTVVNETETEGSAALVVYAIEGPLFFGTASRLGKLMITEHSRLPQTLVLRLGKVPYIDSSGEYVLSAIVARYQTSGVTVLIAGAQPQPLALFKKTGLYAAIGEKHFFAHTEEAIHYELRRQEQSAAHDAQHEKVPIA
jgi:SulP family sulfate permease